MVHAWSAFLSCDTRDMCRASPALSRLVLMWMAAALRIVTLWVFLVADIPGLSWFYGAMYWGSRLNDPAYLEFTSVRDEAHRTREAWARGELTDLVAREEAVRLAAELRRWRERHTGYDLFMSNYDSTGLDCPPFRSREGFFELLEAQERDDGNDWSSCDYLTLLH